VSRANALKAVDRELSERLTRFALTRHGSGWLQDALDETDWFDGGELSEAELQIIIPWLHHFRVNPSDGLTLAAEWRRERERQPRRSADEFVLLDGYASAWLSIWEATEVQPGVGSQLKDVLTGEERFVHDIGSSRSLQRFDSILALVVTCDGISFLGGVHTRPLSPRFAQRTVKYAQRMCGVRTRRVPCAKLRDPEMQLELLALWNDAVDAMLDQPPPVLQNTDGDPFVLTRDDFALLAPHDEIARRLASLDGVQGPEQEGDDAVFTVTKAGNAVHRSWDNTVIGRILLTAERLAVDTNSTRRADTLRSAVESHLQGLVRFRLRKEENTAQMMTAARASSPAPSERARRPLPPEAVEMAREFREQHMRDWVDDQIPALGGLTPMEAARLPRARPKLEVLLKEMERSEARLPERERIDLGWLRETLGFH
jgi:hypothetical protein